MEAVAFGKVSDGILTINSRKSFDNDLKGLKNGLVTITVKRRNQRSLAQNAYIHLLFTIFKNELNQLGNEFKMEQVKEIAKAKFLTVDVVNESTCECIGQRVKGTHELSKVEMMEFVENVIRWAADMFHITLPYPNEQIEIFQS
jgi:hypothetical protein